VHDTIEFEKRGIPATTLITQAFTNAALFQFRAKGMPGHSYIVLPHPISNLSREAMEDVTRQYVSQLVCQLTA
jgi:hypothetical protein